eukprot:5647304-Karenia_brevis.AAC.1
MHAERSETSQMPQMCIGIWTAKIITEHRGHPTCKGCAGAERNEVQRLRRLVHEMSGKNLSHCHEANAKMVGEGSGKSVPRIFVNSD